MPAFVCFAQHIHVSNVYALIVNKSLINSAEQVEARIGLLFGAELFPLRQGNYGRPIASALGNEQ
jgi:hypothetical protein